MKEDPLLFKASATLPIKSIGYAGLTVAKNSFLVP